MLLLLRVFQGIGIGGEWGGAVLMAVEHSRRRPARLLSASWPQIGVPAGLLLSAGVVNLLSFLNGRRLLRLGLAHRLPDQLVLVVVGLYIRLKVMETPAFKQAQEENKIAPVPFVELFRTHGKNTMLGLGARYIEGVTFNLFGVFMVGYLTGHAAHVAAVRACRGDDLIGNHDRHAADLRKAVGPLSGAAAYSALRSLVIGVLSFLAFYLMGMGSTLLV